MAIVLVVGSDITLIEGIAQTLSGAGHRVIAASDITQALDELRGARPLVALVGCGELAVRTGVYQATLAQGGALVAYQCDDDEEETLEFSVKRLVLAKLRLPLERQRLLALVKSVESRAHAVGRETNGESEADEIHPD